MNWLKRKIRDPWLQAHYEQGLLFERSDEILAEVEEFQRNWDTAMHVVHFDDPPLHEIEYCIKKRDEYNLRLSLVLEDICMYRERKEAITILEKLDE